MVVAQPTPVAVPSTLPNMGLGPSEDCSPPPPPTISGTKMSSTAPKQTARAARVRRGSRSCSTATPSSVVHKRLRLTKSRVRAAEPKMRDIVKPTLVADCTNTAGNK